jgi:hypothetical protein
MRQVRVEVFIEDYNTTSSTSRPLAKYGIVITKEMAAGRSFEEVADTSAKAVRETLLKELPVMWEG